MKKLSIITLFLLSQIIGFAEGHNRPFNEMFIFGDSLSCSGNACKHANKKATWCKLFPNGRFTDADGILWHELLADELQIARPEPSLIGGTNFAYGGATSGWDKSKYRLNVGDQISACIKKYKGILDSESLYVIWAGGNDIKNSMFVDINVYDEIISNLEKHITKLARAGAKTFIVPNMPPISQAQIVKDAFNAISIFAGAVSLFGSLMSDEDDLNSDNDAFDALAAAGGLYGGGMVLSQFWDKFTDDPIQKLNYSLKLRLNQLQKDLKITIYQPDIYAYFYEIKQNLNDFNLNSESELFTHDRFHPSAIGHMFIAKAAYESMQVKKRTVGSR